VTLIYRKPSSDQTASASQALMQINEQPSIGHNVIGHRAPFGGDQRWEKLE
jgi:hypothetical protein